MEGSEIPLASVRITPETAPNSSQRASSSLVSLRSPSEKNPPMSDPHVDTPDVPIVSPLVIALARPSKPQSVVGSPPQTIREERALPVNPERA